MIAFLLGFTLGGDEEGWRIKWKKQVFLLKSKRKL